MATKRKLSASFSRASHSRARSDGTANIHTDHMPMSRAMLGSSDGSSTLYDSSAPTTRLTYACTSKMVYSVEPLNAGFFLPAGVLARGANVPAIFRADLASSLSTSTSFSSVARHATRRGAGAGRASDARPAAAGCARGAAARRARAREGADARADAAARNNVFWAIIACRDDDGVIRTSRGEGRASSAEGTQRRELDRVGRTTRARVLGARNSVRLVVRAGLSSESRAARFRDELAPR